MVWANFLHFHQPPTQKKYWVKKISKECYRRVFKGFLENPNIRLTMNVSGVLLELWDKFGEQDLISQLKQLVNRGQVELTASAKYHPLLPKLPEEEIVRQIRLDEETIRKYLGDAPLRGFFPPECAYDRRVAKIAASLGFEWVLAEELSLNHEFGAIDYSTIYEVTKDTDLKIFFRERETSYKILSGQIGTQNLFLSHLGNRISKNQYLLTAMDGETFGHHRPGMEKTLFELYKTEGIKAVTISQLPDLFEKRKRVKTLPSTWALMAHDLEKNVPFARWDDPGNEIHRMQWQLTDLAIKSVRASKRQGNEQWLEARHLLDRALHSSQYWWASARPWWSLEIMERGAKMLKDVVLMVPDVPKPSRLKAKRLYYDIITTGFDWQREGRVERMARAEDEAVRMRTDRGIPELPSEEVDKMIAVIRKEMLEVAKNQEYERAAQLRDRIKELEGYKK